MKEYLRYVTIVSPRVPIQEQLLTAKKDDANLAITTLNLVEFYLLFVVGDHSLILVILNNCWNF